MIDLSLSNATRWQAALTRLDAPPSDALRVRTVWDDENPDWNFKSRTQDPGFVGPSRPPAPMRFYRNPIEKEGDFRVNMASPYDWKQQIIALNDGVYGDWEYLVGPKRASYNSTGWPMQAYLTFCNNVLLGEFVGSWFRFVTLTQSDVVRAAGMTKHTHPEFVHHFTCVGWKDGQTLRIDSTGTPRGEVLFYLVTKEGVGWIPARHVVRLEP